MFCSRRCFSRYHDTTSETVCANCGESFPRRASLLETDNLTFCSRSCAASYNNSRGATGRKRRYSREDIIDAFHDFYRENGRPPRCIDFERRSPNRWTVVSKFGSWNNAVEAAGFETNSPSGFGSGTFAADGHWCDSQAERVIDDWLFQNGVPHGKEPDYPGDNSYRADWLIGDTLIEYAGLSMAHYRRQLALKREIAEQFGYPLIILESTDEEYLDEKLGHLRDAAHPRRPDEVAAPA
ncbi:MAG: homing endonuclease associated repeat-containing protein [Anaerolineae bacterium]